MHIRREILFRGDALRHERVTIPADLYNHTRLLLHRADIGTGCVFVPVRTLQFQAVITSDEVVFVDSQGYAVRNGEGGRVILLAWQFDPALHRDSLTEPVPIDVVHYGPNLDVTQRRLLSEFHQAVNLLLERQSPTQSQSKGQCDAGMKVVSIASRPK